MSDRIYSGVELPENHVRGISLVLSASTHEVFFFDKDGRSIPVALNCRCHPNASTTNDNDASSNGSGEGNTLPYGNTAGDEHQQQGTTGSAETPMETTVATETAVQMDDDDSDEAGCPCCSAGVCALHDYGPAQEYYKAHYSLPLKMGAIPVRVNA
ncbi:hypothetical protein DQ04_09291010 [Trypanosoma grayi]|uniref:hypothetical protein n=1 Tax=Trypanosoma grayi TaxID=71804 RepID=UPI0004F49308|nr:hypothetical protein DQ04_09291010 [Trypanosoma grayi]KEG07609.1 hypothetical protein DQ04_09291010 [Trypanosoma grayi]